MTPVSPPEQTVYVVEGKPEVAQALQRILAVEGLASFCYSSAEAFLAHVPQNHGGCLVLNLQLPGKSGLELLTAWQGQKIPLPAIVTTGQTTVKDVIRAFQAGAFHVIEQPVDSGEFLDSVRQAMAVDAQRRAADHQRERRLLDLTAREREVLELLVEDKATKQIARELGLSPSTIEKHRAKILTKVGVSSVVGLTKFHFANSSEMPRAHLRFQRPTIRTSAAGIERVARPA